MSHEVVNHPQSISVAIAAVNLTPDDNQMLFSPSQPQRTTGPTRVPGTYSPEWLPDRETDSCMACDTLFTLIKRRHHCRSCGKIFCGECCRLKAKLLYLDNKEARVCNQCHQLIEFTLTETDRANHTSIIQQIEETNRATNNPPDSGPSTSSNINYRPDNSPGTLSSGPIVRKQGVLKNSGNLRNRPKGSGFNTEESQNGSDSSDQASKQVMFSDGIRPGTDLSESFPHPMSPGSSSSQFPTPYSQLSRQAKDSSDGGASSSVSKEPSSSQIRNKKSSIKEADITVCDELGYLPPIVVNKNAPILRNSVDQSTSLSSNPVTNMIVNHFRGSSTIQASMESRNCPLNGIVKFEEISSLVGLDNTITFLLLRDFKLKVKLIEKSCCIDRNIKINRDCSPGNSPTEIIDCMSKNGCDGLDIRPGQTIEADNKSPKYWSFASEGLSKFGQSEIVLVVDKDKNDDCVPRDVFKVYLTLHELSLRRQSLENLGNLLFQDGLFGYRDTAGLLFIKPLQDHCLNGIILPKDPFLVALILQRWEVPWSKVFPMRLMLRLGHKLDVYPYPIVSFRTRDPVYYEVGHTIISILGDFRNFRYSITHVEGLKVMINKSSRKVLVQLNQSNYQQFNQVLDSSNNEHVLAWSSCPFSEADGHLVSVQNEDGQYETVEFLKQMNNQDASFKGQETVGPVLGASFIIFSGALKVNQSGQSAKISIVEDGLLVQIQSCTMSALKNSIHYMHHFDIDCGNDQDPLNRVEIDWQSDGT